MLPDKMYNVVDDYWTKLFSAENTIIGNNVEVAIDEGLDESEGLMILCTSDGYTKAKITPEIANLLPCIKTPQKLNEKILRSDIQAAGIILNGADYLFYLPKTRINTDRISHCGVMLDESHHEQVKAFQANCPEEELDNAYVELDHWAVAGLFLHDQLVSMASAYPWDDSAICDIGIITTPAMRQRGHAREVLWMLSKHIMTKNYIPQYRCQLDNHASIALAKSMGYSEYGTWDVKAAID